MFFSADAIKVIYLKKNMLSPWQGSQNVPATGDFVVYFHIFAG
jgi:hypothetical protein